MREIGESEWVSFRESAVVAFAGCLGSKGGNIS
jgi:hypothetical protein